MMWSNWSNGTNATCGFGFGWHMIGMGLFWAVIISLIVYFIFKDRNKDSNYAKDILRERFARGEITEEEFQKKFTYLK